MGRVPFAVCPLPPWAWIYEPLARREVVPARRDQGLSGADAGADYRPHSGASVCSPTSEFSTTDGP